MAVTLRPTTLRRLFGVIGAVALLGLAAWFVHDGWFNVERQHDPGFLWFNRILALLCPVGVAWCIVHAVGVSQESIVLDDAGLSVHGGEPISVERIVKIDDSTYDEDGYLRLIHKTAEGREESLTIDAQKYDGADELLDELFDRTKLPSLAAADESADEAEAAEDAPPAEPDSQPDQDADSAAESKDA